MLVARAGSPVQAELAGIDDLKTVRFLVDGKVRAVALDEIVIWGAYRDETRHTCTVLSDGGLLAADVTGIDERRVSLQSDLFDEMTVPRRLVRGLIFQLPARPVKRDRLLERITASTSVGDRLLLSNGDLQSGKVTAGGTDPDVFGVDSLQLLRQSDESPLEFDVQSIDACIFGRRPAARLASAIAFLGFRDGTLVAVSSLIEQEGQVTVKTPGGLVMRARTESFWRELVMLQPESADIDYLSEMDGLGYKHIPFLDLGWPLGLDRNARGARLRSDRVLYRKGVGMHSTSRLVCELAGRYRRFDAELAIDDLSGRTGSVVYRVFLERADANGKNSWGLAFESPVVRGGDSPLSMSVDLSGALRIALVVDFADRGDEGDHANWLNARLVR